jgi:cytochrome b subunit of formate dehydrogenase
MSDPKQAGGFAGKRRLAAKRFNEQVKLLASGLNTLGVTTFAAGCIVPSFAGQMQTFPWISLIIALVLHCSAQLALRTLRSED